MLYILVIKISQHAYLDMYIYGFSGHKLFQNCIKCFTLSLIISILCLRPMLIYIVWVSKC